MGDIIEKIMEWYSNKITQEKYEYYTELKDIQELLSEGSHISSNYDDRKTQFNVNLTKRLDEIHHGLGYETDNLAVYSLGYSYISEWERLKQIGV